jgi:hypothetical protein
MKSVNDEPGSPFESIEGAHQYVGLLCEALEEARSAIQQDADAASRTRGAERRIEALQIVTYKLNQLAEHLAASRRLLNDLRTLRRLLLREREDTAAAPPDQT